MTDSGYVQARSDNLPKIDAFMMGTFFAESSNFISAEIRGAKSSRSQREEYGDNAIGYVQVKREENVCTVKAKITPEHKVRKKAYNVVLVCNEKEGSILSVQCEDCAAHLGGCKHAVAFVAWLHRRSEDPATTEVDCYWRKSKLSSVGTSLKFIKAKDLGKSEEAALEEVDGSFLASVVDYSREVGKMDTQLLKYFKEHKEVEKLSIHYLINTFLSRDGLKTFYDFEKFCCHSMQFDSCKEAFKATVNQATCPLWFELRYARITASTAYDAAHCNTMEGSLVESIFGASKLKDSAAMRRGRDLEISVIRAVENKMKLKIKKCGLILSAKYPIFGASPDGETENYVIEVKCPATEKSFKRYLNQNDKISAKYMAQVQMQMLFANKQQALFCIAEPDFETSNSVKIIIVDFDESYCTNLIEKCREFWTSAIFTLLTKNRM